MILHYCVALIILLPIVHGLLTLPLPRLTYSIHDVEHGPLQSVVKLSETGDVIAAGQNALYRLTHDLDIVSVVTTGPVQDNPQCRPMPLLCPESRSRRDVYNRVLLQLPSQRAILSCCTAEQGICSLYTSNLTLISRADTSNVYNYMASRGSTAAFFDNKSSDKLFVGSSYDQRSAKYYPFTLSALTVDYKEQDGTVDTKAVLDSVRIDEGRLNSYRIDFVHGFAYEDYAYFLTVQNSEGRYETRLGRVCREDTSFRTYSEISLDCGAHNAAQAAALDVQKRQGSTHGNATLFVAFGSPGTGHGAPGTGPGYVNDPLLGSAVCLFNMNDVVRALEKATTDCNDATSTSSLLEWPRAQDADRTCKRYAAANPPDFCAPGNNFYVKGLAPLNGTVIFKKEDVVLTSLLPVRETLVRAVWIGDSSGFLHKYEMAPEETVYDAIDIAEGNGTAVEKSVAFDPEDGFAYFLTGNKVIRFPVDVCSRHTDCRSCTRLYSHQANCAWCGNRCVPERECPSGSQLCEPTILTVDPERGHQSGGTRLIIEGTGFAPYPDTYNTTTVVIIGDEKCAIDFFNDTLIECMTPAAVTAGPAKIEVQLISGYYLELTGSGLIRNVSAPVPFTYVIPKFLDMSPTSGPLFGGTSLTLFGEGLDVGSSRSITIENSTCEIVSVESKKITCTTPDMRYTQDHRDRISLIVDFYVNGALVRYTPGKGKAQRPIFTFARNPVFHSLRPNPDMDSSEENVTAVDVDNPHVVIQGANLDSIARPEHVNVRVGTKDRACNEVEISSDMISCTLTNPSDLNGADPLPIEVVVYGKSYSLGMIRVTSPKLSFAVIFGSLVVVAIVIAIVICTLLYIRWRRNRAERMRVEYKSRVRGDNNTAVRNEYVSIKTGRSTETKDRVDVPSCVLTTDTIDMLKQEKILFPREHLDLGPVIGRGHFGCVYRGTLSMKDKGVEIAVAVKTLKNASSSADVEKFLEEALLMKDFQHENVLSLVGACIDTEGQVLVITPYMMHGDLLSYIRNEQNVMTVQDVITFGIDIAKGMEYLAEKRFVHRDLAARNCMLSEDFTVRVADFGLSRDIYESDYYSTDNSKSKLPIKWMAPESLEKGVYNHKTDVWSYGIVLWELITRGVTPYPGIDNWDTLEVIKRGRRMRQPCLCPDMLYQVMLRCWAQDPNDRPSFSGLVKEVPDVLRVTAEKNRNSRVSLTVTYVNCPDVNAQEARA